MKKNIFLKFNDTDCQYEVFGDDLVLLNFKTGHYVSAAGSGKIIFDTLIQGAGVEDILSEVKVRYPEYSSNTSEFIKTLRVQEFLVECAEPSQKPVMKLAMVERPLVNVFDDMADLIKSDPVHDADESMGWPVKKQMI
jgi:hypothetical protein